MNRGNSKTRSVSHLDKMLQDVATPMLTKVATDLINRVTAPDETEEHDVTDSNDADGVELECLQEKKGDIKRRATAKPVSRRRFVVTQCNALLIAVFLCLAAFCYLLANNRSVINTILEVVENSARPLDPSCSCYDDESYPDLDNTTSNVHQ